MRKQLSVLAASLIFVSNSQAFQSAENPEGSTMVVTFNGPGGYQLFDTGVLAADFAAGNTAGFQIDISSAVSNLGEIDSYSIFGITGGNLNLDTYVDYSTGVVFTRGEQNVYPTHYVDNDSSHEGIDLELRRLDPNLDRLVPPAGTPFTRGLTANIALAYLEGLRTGERVLLWPDSFAGNLQNGTLLNEDGQVGFHVALENPSVFCCLAADFLFGAFGPFQPFDDSLDDSIYSLAFADVVGSPDAHETMIPANYSISLDGSIFSVTSVPVPSAVWLFMGALGSLGIVRRRLGS